MCRALILGLLAAIAMPAAEPGRSITILDWNIDRGEDLDSIAQSIRDQQPDIATLQEVDLNARRSGRKDVAKELAARLGVRYAFGRAFEEINQGTRETPAYQGQATLSRLTIRASRVIEFSKQTSFWKPEPYLPSWFPQRRLGGRVALVTEIEAGRRTLVVYNLHLESRGPGYTRYAQLHEVLLDARRYPDATPIVVAGDINAKYMPGKFASLLEEAGFHDCFRGHRPRTHKIIFSLDWIFMRGPVTCEHAQVVRDVRGSDHYAVVVQAVLR